MYIDYILSKALQLRKNMNFKNSYVWSISLLLSQTNYTEQYNIRIISFVATFLSVYYIFVIKIHYTNNLLS